VATPSTPPKAAEKPAPAPAPTPPKAAEKPAPAPAPTPPKAAEKPAPAPAPTPPKAAEKPAPAPAKAAKPAKAATTATVIVAKYDVGHGNNMYIRGEGAGLSWDVGILMENAGNDVWVWTTNEAKEGGVSFKFLINDAGWSTGDNMTAPAGETTTLFPAF
jgi:outer membrane biosynthesis protein TonB